MLDKIYIGNASGIAMEDPAIEKAYMGDANGIAQLIYQRVQGISAAVVTLGAALTYNGSVQTKEIESVVLDGKTLVEGTDYTVSGNTGTNAGSYTLTITGIGDYEGSVTKPWSIAKLSLTKPTVSGSYTYNGSTLSCSVSNMNSVYITQSGTTSATNAGEYTVTFTLKSTSNTQWSDGTTAAVSRTWSIAKASGSISVSPAKVDILGPVGTTSTATITYTGDGAISVTSNKTSVATVSRSGKTVTVKSVAAGSATITITMAAGTNYTGASCTISVTIAVPAFGSYSGEYEQLDDVTIDGAKYELYRLIGSGTLVLNGSAKAWLCGGGGGGGSKMLGGGGGGGYVKSGTLAEGTHTITVGVGGDAASAGGATKAGTTLTANPGSGATSAAGAAGGSGGGESGYVNATGGGSGAGTSTYPFGLTSLKAHSAGGAGGTFYASGKYYKGGTGGTNGGDGGSNGTESTTLVIAEGGEYGGGKGGSASPQAGYAGGAASFYGGGGGGAGRYSSNSTASNKAGGAGYPGVVYIAVPA